MLPPSFPIWRSFSLIEAKAENLSCVILPCFSLICHHRALTSGVVAPAVLALACLSEVHLFEVLSIVTVVTHSDIFLIASGPLCTYSCNFPSIDLRICPLEISSFLTTSLGLVLAHFACLGVMLMECLGHLWKAVSLDFLPEEFWFGRVGKDSEICIFFFF